MIVKSYNIIKIEVLRIRNLLNEIKSKLDQASIHSDRINNYDSDFTADSVKLLTMHSIKGLEFPYVFVLGINVVIIPHRSIELSNKRKVLYVGMTRASEKSYLSSSGSSSSFIKDNDKNYLRLNTKLKLRSYYHVCVEKYQFLKEIAD